MRSVALEGTGDLVAYLEAESRERVPESVETAARNRIVDTLAAATAGHQVTDVGTAFQVAQGVFGAGDITILDGSGDTMNGAGATLVNTLAANELDVDDGNRLAEGHPAAVILPAALAAVEAEDGTIGDLVDAFLPAYEIGVRTALAMHEWLGMHSGSGSWGAVAAAAAVSRARGFAPETAEDALAIAEFNAPITPVMRSVANPAGSMTKDGIGWGGFVGYVAATFAEAGFGGSGTVFDEIEHDSLDHSLLESLGDRYHIQSGYFKPYPACRWIHPGIDAVGDLFAEHSIDVGSIETIHVHTHPKGAQLGARRPTTPGEAEYSYPFVIARAVLNRGRFEAADLHEDARTDSETLQMADRVSLHVDPRAAERYPEESLARVTIETDEESLESPLVTPLGAADRPMPENRLESKWERQLDETLGSGATRTVRERITADDEPVGYLLAPWQD